MQKVSYDLLSTDNETQKTNLVVVDSTTNNFSVISVPANVTDNKYYLTYSKSSNSSVFEFTEFIPGKLEIQGKGIVQVDNENLSTVDTSTPYTVLVKDSNTNNVFAKIQSAHLDISSDLESVTDSILSLDSSGSFIKNKVSSGILYLDSNSVIKNIETSETGFLQYNSTDKSLSFVPIEIPKVSVNDAVSSKSNNIVTWDYTN